MNENQDKTETSGGAGTVLAKAPRARVANAAGGGKRVQSSHATRRPPVLRPPLEDDEDEHEGFFKRHAIGLAAIVFVLAGTLWMIFGKPLDRSGPIHKPQETQVVRLVLPPPPPPPPPVKLQPTPPPKEEKKTEDAAPDKPVDKAVEKPKPVDKPPQGLGTSIRGSGPGMDGLSYGNGNGVIGGGSGTGSGSPGAYYAGQVMRKVQQVLSSNQRLRNASIAGLRFTVSVDGTGRITGVKLAGSTNDPALDSAIANEILIGLQINDPPQNKPMTVTMQLRAERTRQSTALQSN